MIVMIKKWFKITGFCEFCSIVKWFRLQIALATLLCRVSPHFPPFCSSSARFKVHIPQWLVLLLSGEYWCHVTQPRAVGIVLCFVKCIQGHCLFWWYEGYVKQQKLIASVQWYAWSFPLCILKPIQLRKRYLLTYAHILDAQDQDCMWHQCVGFVKHADHEG